MNNIEYISCQDISLFTKEQIQDLTVDDLQKLSDAQQIALTAEQRSWMSEDQLLQVR